MEKEIIEELENFKYKKVKELIKIYDGKYLDIPDYIWIPDDVLQIIWDCNIILC